MASKSGYLPIATDPPSYDASTASASASASAYPPRPRPPSSRPGQPNLEPFMHGPPNAEPPLDLASASRWELQVHQGWIEPQVWDSTLLNDPDNLYDFVRAQAFKPPELELQIFDRNPKGDSSSGVFSFKIVLSPLPTGTVCTRSRLEPTYRGSLERTLPASSPGTPGRKPTSRELKGWDTWRQERHDRGLPPWSASGQFPDFLRSSSGLSCAADDGADGLYEWCEAYAADRGLLKSFVINRPVWGWDLGALKSTIKRAIADSGYQRNVNISISNPYALTDRLVVRPGNPLSHIRPYLWFPPIGLLYLFIYILLRVTGRAGGCYDVALVCFPFKSYPPVPDTHPGESVDAARARLGLEEDALLVPGPNGVHSLAGEREGDWLNRWQDQITVALRSNTRGYLTVSGDRVLDGYVPKPAERCLDGYEPTPRAGTGSEEV